MAFRVFPKKGTPVPDAATSAQVLEQSAPWLDAPSLPLGSSVVLERQGPGDQPEQDVDSWLFTIRDAPHDGIETGKALFAMLPDVPPEGHGGFDIPTSGPDSFIDRATTEQFVKWSDWYATRGEPHFDGAHVAVFRVRPGSWQGYQGANQMTGLNVDRNQPDPWDQHLIAGAQ